MKIFAVEGNSQRLDGGAMFGNCPRALWERWTDVDAINRIHLACRALLVQTDDGRNVLFEAGIGAFFDPKLRERFGIVEEAHVLLRNLARLGLRDADIDQVVLSHLHFDHAGGIVSAFSEGPLRLLFPKAIFYTGKHHFGRAQHPHIRDKGSFIPLINDLLIDSGRLKLVEGLTHPDLDFGVSFRYSEGHTPGLMLASLELDTGPLVFVSDLIPGMPWMHLPITMGYDRYPEKLVDEKRRLLEELIQRNGKIFFTHDPEIPCASIQQDESGRFFGSPIDIESLNLPSVY
ncbi:MAG: MBL fold metallo-hydrolase [Chlamydiales bacterium]|nr:MBL fold metallo-hydrolase [Chlamydiales bacterium]